MLACSQTLSCLLKVHQAYVIKNKNRGGFIDGQRKGVEVGKKQINVPYISFSHSTLMPALHACSNALHVCTDVSKKKKQCLCTG